MSWHRVQRWYRGAMTSTQRRLRELRERQSKERQRMAELSLLDSLDAETRAELDGIEAGTPDLERQIRAAQTSVDAEDRASVIDAAADGRPEGHERAELRASASVGRMLTGKLGGSDRELLDELGLAAGQIPLELWQRPETRAAEERAITPAPTTGIGVNLDPIRPYVFAPSVVDKLMVEMPMVESGSYSTGTITTAATADAVPKATDSTGDVPETAAAIETETTGPHRVGASLNLAAEDIAAIGAANFESILRQHISLVLSAELDNQMLNGDGTNDDLMGLFNKIGSTSLTTPGAAVADFDDFVASFVAGIDGLWATMASQVGVVAGVDTYKIAAAAFRDASGADLGDMSLADYAMAHYGGLWCNSRMPAAVSNIQSGILTRRGMSMLPDPGRVAVCPHWGYLSIDDIYTGARKGQRRYVLSVLCGDVLLVQPDAYGLVTFRVST